MSRLAFTLALSLTALACSPSNSPSSKTDQGVIAGDPADADADAGACSADPPIAAFCAPCESGYRIEDGEPTCTCCDAPAQEAGACCDPTQRPAQQSPEGTYCCADGTWQASPGGGGESTCNRSGHGGLGKVCGAEPAEVCGDAPLNALCAQCAAGYKQINGQPTCHCCGE